MSVSPVESSILITEILEKYHRMRNEISQKIAVSEFSLEKIFFWEFCKIDNWQQSLAFFLLNSSSLLSWIQKKPIYIKR